VVSFFNDVSSLAKLIQSIGLAAHVQMSDIGKLNLNTLLEQAHTGIVIDRWGTSIAHAPPTALLLFRLSYKQIIGKDVFVPQWSFIDDAGRKLLIEDYPANKVNAPRSDYQTK